MNTPVVRVVGEKVYQTVATVLADLLSLATPAEKYLHRLLMGRDYSRSNVTIKEVEGIGRSAFANKNFSAGDFVCEYSSNV